MSNDIRTHYDVLMVSRTAPHEVIVAAYRALSKRFHPDQNPNDPRAEIVMRVINASYAVLSDPERRRAHDRWIAAQEALDQHNNATPQHTEEPEKQERQKGQGLLRHVGRYWLIYASAAFIGAMYLIDRQPPRPSGLPDYVENPSPEVAETGDAPSQPEYERPAKAPNGKAWPTNASYVNGYPIARSNGLSKLTIDNGSNSTDMFVKLVALDADKTLPIRHAYVPAHKSFTMNNIRAGQYDVRYMDLSDGSLSRSESFVLEEISEPGGVRFSVTTMTLYKIQNGNMQTYSLAPDEF